MKIKKVNIEKGGQANFADKIEKVVYAEHLGVSREQFEEFKNTIRNLADLHERFFAFVKEVDSSNSETEKKSKKEKLKTFALNSGVSIAQSMSASAIFETIKYLLS